MRTAAPLMDRLVQKIDVLAPDGCWQWISTVNSEGYGQIRISGKQRGAHRVVYEELVGPIPEGLQLDHLCRNRSCVNPDHLEPVTHRENWRRGDHPAAIVQRNQACKHGHSMDDAYVDPKSGWRTCRTCQQETQRRSYRARKLGRTDQNEATEWIAGIVANADMFDYVRTVRPTVGSGGSVILTGFDGENPVTLSVTVEILVSP